MKSMLFWFINFQLLFFTPFVIAADKLAIKNFETAIGFCERVLQAEMPKSSGSLRVLKSNWKKYQNNVQNALERAPDLAKTNSYTYSGGYFVEKAYSSIYQICNEELPEKINEAVAHLDELRRDRVARLNQQRALLKAIEQKTKIAKNYVTEAIDRHCATYVRSPSPNAIGLQISYQTAKQKALEIYPEITRHFHEATIFNSKLGQEEIVNKTVGSWFEFCDMTLNVNIDPAVQLSSDTVPVLSDHAGLILPPLPTDISDNVPPPPQIPISESVIEAAEDEEKAYSEEDDPEFQQAIQTVKGDRIKVLEKEKRLPDYVDHEDFNLNLSTWWRYENENATACVTYNFKVNSLTRTHEQPGECPLDD